MLWVLIRIASAIKPTTHWNCLAEAILMCTHNVFMENWQKLSFNYHQILTLSVPLVSITLQLPYHCKSHVTYKPYSEVCKQEQHKLPCSVLDTKSIVLPRQRKTRTLNKPHGCAGWSASFLFVHGLNRFCLNMAQLSQVMRKCVLWYMRTTKVQISLRIRAVWSAPLLFAVLDSIICTLALSKFQDSS